MTKFHPDRSAAANHALDIKQTGEKWDYMSKFIWENGLSPSII